MLAYDIGVRVGSDLWGDEMKAVAKIMKRESQKTEVRALDEFLVGWTKDVMRDLRLWVGRRHKGGAKYKGDQVDEDIEAFDRGV
jgi:hypothetical protein